MTGRRPDHRVVLDNLHLGWPAETVAAAQAEYDAQLRSLRPDDPGVEPPADCRTLRAPARHVDDGDDGTALVAMIELAAAMIIGLMMGILLMMAAR